MQQLCRQHGFHSKHLRLKQCYSVYYYYHIMSRLSFILSINGRHDIMKTISTTLMKTIMKTISTTFEETTSTALMRIFNDVASTRKNIDRVSRLASKFITPKDKFIYMHRFTNICALRGCSY